MNKPILDPRTKEDLMDLIQRRAGEYVPEWRYEQGDETDPGAAIATLFGEMFYQTIDRFNLQALYGIFKPAGRARAGGDPCVRIGAL